MTSQTLRKVQSELLAELAPEKSVDPLSRFPVELAEQTLGYLSFKQLMNVCRVSKKWSTFINGSPNLWRNLDLSQARRKVKNAFVSRAISVGRLKLKSATLGSLYDFHKVIRALANSGTLENLTLLDDHVLTDDTSRDFYRFNNLKLLDFRGAVTHRRVVRILQSLASTLEVVRFQKLMFAPHGTQLDLLPIVEFPKLRTLEITMPNFGIHLDASVFLFHKNMPNLEKIKLHEYQPAHSHDILEFQELTQLTHLDLLLDITRANKIKVPGTLKSLAIATWKPSHADFFDDDPNYPPLQWHLFHLEELRICVADVPFHCLGRVLRTDKEHSEAPPALLRILSMAKSNVGRDGALTTRLEAGVDGIMHPRLAALERFSLEGCLDPDDNTMSLIKEHVPELRSLNVSGSVVTGAGIKALIELGYLKHLVAYDCRNLGLDAVEWARSAGVRVEYGMTTNLSGGKKVRY